MKLESSLATFLLWAYARHCPDQNGLLSVPRTQPVDVVMNQSVPCLSSAVTGLHILLPTPKIRPNTNSALNGLQVVRPGRSPIIN
ncbi:hypothetical protein BZA05DRAFT_411256 [Tricharina praecox]|uniref:uncharacterized protein n=1 Tax=Tricharina praecox TaxID=43433 RepID=UPI00221ED248|nr:uncharacterized protein BZA05DRAFT_411256 [Tricharina praecox]KAI5843149.1 hypothetical protein BZA05DRAFT_411256 [Tricharina praecox]